jgi:hypothetical protein
MRDSVYIVDVEEGAFRSPENTRVILYSSALGGGINNAEHLIEVILKELAPIRCVSLPFGVVQVVPP